MGNEKYLLYIDILGFSDLVKNNPEKILLLFDRINELNAHKHNHFKVIVFSDTILVFNKVASADDHDHKYLVMYAIEFAQDLLFRCIDLKIQFRAILTCGYFEYKKLENIEAYYGEALIRAYLKEKDISCMGLFIDRKLQHHNIIFKSEKFDEDFDFVYLTQALERLKVYYSKGVVIDNFLVEQTFEFANLKEEVEILRILKERIESETSTKIREKYINTYNFYKKRYEVIVEDLEMYSFNYRQFSPTADWTSLG